MLDPAQNDSFTDHYLNVPFDLSEVLFIATANFIQNIPGPLLDRMEVARIPPGYTEREKAEIAKSYLIPRQLEESGLSDKGVRFTDDAVMSVVSLYTRESGVRQLERQVGAVARKVARKIAGGGPTDVEITPEAVRELLGRPRVHPERVGAANEVGVATGMYYTPAGGDIMFVEAAIRQLAAPPAQRAEPPLGLGKRLSHSYGPTWRCDERIGARGVDVRRDARLFTLDSARTPGLDRSPHPRPSRRHPQGRPVGGRGHGHGDRVCDVGAPGATRHGDDRRNHAPRTRPADRRRQGESPW